MQTEANPNDKSFWTYKAGNSIQFELYSAFGRRHKAALKKYT